MALSGRLRLFAPRAGAAAARRGCSPPDARTRGGQCRADRRRGVVQRPDRRCPMRQAAELAAEEINASGGINGKRLELVIRDDYADPDSAVFVASDLYDSDVSAVVGHLFSGMTLAAAPVYNGGSDPVVADQPLVLVARRDRRRQLHLPHLSQRPRPRHRAGALGPRPPPPDPRRGALPQRRVRPRHPPDVRHRVRPPRRRAAGRRPVPRRPARRRRRTSTAWRRHAPRVHRRGRQPRARRRRSCARRGSAASRCRCSAATASRASRRPARWPRACTSPRPTFPSIPSAPNRRFVAGVPPQVPRRRDAQPAGRRPPTTRSTCCAT